MHALNFGKKKPNFSYAFITPQWHIGLQSNCQISCNTTRKTTYMFASQLCVNQISMQVGGELIIPLDT
jgi:hypothetical protein